MSGTPPTRESLELREFIGAHRAEIFALLDRYGARNPRIFGSVAGGTAGPSSDIDIVVDMDPADGNLLLRASGLLEETRQLLGREDIDIFPRQLLKRSFSADTLRGSIAI